MSCMAFLTTMLVAASMPLVPAPSRNFALGVLFLAAKSSTALTTRVSVSALWSFRKTESVSRLQGSL